MGRGEHDLPVVFFVNPVDIFLPEQFCWPLVRRYLLESDSHSFCITVNAIVGTAGTTVDSFYGPFLCAVVFLAMFHTMSPLKSNVLSKKKADLRNEDQPKILRNEKANPNGSTLKVVKRRPCALFVTLSVSLLSLVQC
jgi:hypothetical protein